MTPDQHTNTMTHAHKADHGTPVYSSPCPQAAQQQPLIAIMSLPDGSEILLRATETGWTVTENGVRSIPNSRSARKNDLDLLEDIAAAYGFGPSHRRAVSSQRGLAHETKRPKLTLVSSH